MKLNKNQLILLLSIHNGRIVKTHSYVDDLDLLVKNGYLDNKHRCTLLSDIMIYNIMRICSEEQPDNSVLDRITDRIIKKLKSNGE